MARIRPLAVKVLQLSMSAEPKLRAFLPRSFGPGNLLRSRALRRLGWVEGTDPRGMPTKIVVDVSAIAAVLFGEPEGSRVAEQLGDSSLVAPTLFSYEIANICWKKLRRYPEKTASRSR